MAGMPGDLFSPGAEDQAGGGLAGKLYLPKMISGGAAKEWFDRQRSTIRPWAVFVDQRRFSKPKNLGELCKRLVKNVEHFQSNYIFVLLGLILYCMSLSRVCDACPCLVCVTRALSRVFDMCPCLVSPGREVTPAHQYGLASGVSFPFFWLAGAGSAVFWVLGATIVLIGSHAGFREIEGGDADDLLMEPDSYLAVTPVTALPLTLSCPPVSPPLSSPPLSSPVPLSLLLSPLLSPSPLLSLSSPPLSCPPLLSPLLTLSCPPISPPLSSPVPLSSPLSSHSLLSPYLSSSPVPLSLLLSPLLSPSPLPISSPLASLLTLSCPPISPPLLSPYLLPLSIFPLSSPFPLSALSSSSLSPPHLMTKAV
ncbi:prenylated Rab acceptor protein 1 isoform X1 [Huso huso]|uniref:Prenylated Rab acceptor protein 1 n=1 Tax=Huso huso TaxID=61971 RepID=A0ABR0YBD4_HUSHU